ncbi:hypothetical protein B0H10DRAFT_1950496 [Mycena sp. CBHHK59/15]|nr:hypothetical protein B0H10DRAFT_1950496 [Mycena sp. CBHHK59/15]
MLEVRFPLPLPRATLDYHIDNLGGMILISGTVGAATEAVLKGIHAAAFSGATGSQISYTTLDNGTSPLTPTALTYAALILNINYPSTTNCTTPSAFKFVLTRINVDANATDVRTCGPDHLLDESSAIALPGCFVTVSVFNPSTKGDVDSKTQALVLSKLKSLLSCPS